MANKQDVECAFNRGLLEAISIVRNGLVGGEDDARNALHELGIKTAEDLHHVDLYEEYTEDLHDLVE